MDEPVWILGASGYVGGELLRLLDDHPTWHVEGAVSRQRAGQRLGEAFPTLDAPLSGESFTTWERFLERVHEGGRLHVFSATPHAETAPLVEEALAVASTVGADIAWVDLSADFRLRDTAQWESTYGVTHPSPAWNERALSTVPELHRAPDGDLPRLIAHPGCFTTAVTLACAPLAAAGARAFHVSAVTGSTGSGRSPSEGTHHPERHANLHAYRPLHHRHAPEMEQILTAVAGDDVTVHFVPHSGPFARGILATVQCPMEGASREPLTKAARKFYGDQPFIQVLDAPPRLKHVVGTNRAQIAFDGTRDTAVAICAIDNLTKGAAGGAVQWMNRLRGLPADTGLPRHGVSWL